MALLVVLHVPGASLAVLIFVLIILKIMPVGFAAFSAVNLPAFELDSGIRCSPAFGDIAQSKYRI
jgi:hypothetical protein